MAGRPDRPARRTMIGQTLAHYEILGQLGQGGMATVYRARDLQLDREVALKVLELPGAPDPARLERFRREARVLAALNHPNIVTLFSVEQSAGVVFLTMERVEGASLLRAIPRGGLPLPRFYDLAVQIAEALAAAHDKGVTHRDLKPANVMVTADGRIKVLDFGLARMAAAADSGATSQWTTDSLTGEGLVAGTVPYMSPEQLQGLPVDPRSDVFSLGVLLYEMASGVRPFLGETSPAVIVAILEAAPRPLADVVPGLPAGLDRLIRGCLEKDRGRRRRTARQVRDELEALRRDKPSGEAETTARSMPGRGLAGRSRAARLARFGTAAGAVLLAAVVGLWLGRGGGRPAAGPGAARAEPPSIAVLPFLDAGGDHEEDEVFSDGLSEELLDGLARIPGLRVTSRTSAFYFKGKDVDLATVAEKLGVDHVLEGGVRRSGGRVRITVRLIEVASDSQLWSQAYDRELGDVFAVQQDVARAVARALEVRLLESERPRWAGASDPSAYDAYLHGRYFAARRTAADLEKAVAAYRRAVEIDSGYAQAWAELSAALASQATRGYLPMDEGFAQAREAAGRALALAPDLPLAWVASSGVRIVYDWDWRGAEADLEHALELDPGFPEALRSAASLAFARGRTEDALVLLRRAVERDPLNLSAQANLGMFAYAAGRWSEAEAAWRKVLELEPEYPAIRSLLARLDLARSAPEAALRQVELESEPFWRLFGSALVLHALGRTAEADDALDRLVEEEGDNASFQIAELHAFRGEADQAFQFLELAFSQRDSGLYTLRGDPLLVPLHDDPRWAAFLRRLNPEGTDRDGG